LLKQASKSVDCPKHLVGKSWGAQEPLGSERAESWYERCWCFLWA